MKKLMITLSFLMSVSVSAFAEGLEKLENAPIDNLILSISVAVVVLGIVVVIISAYLGITTFVSKMGALF